MSGQPSHRLKKAKRDLRRSILERRDALSPEEHADRSGRIVSRLLELAELRRAGSAMAFWSFGSEVQTGELIERLHRAGTTVLLPRSGSGELVVAQYAPGDPVTASTFGAMEPMGAEVSATEVDAVIAPGVAFDRAGRRLGYGGGFYDRFIARLRPGVPVIAVAFALQVVDEVPEGRPDRRVDAIVTETEVIRCRASSRLNGQSNP